MRTILLFEGINDIAGASTRSTPQDHISAQQIIDAMTAPATRAHQRGIKIWAATLLPFGAAEWPCRSAAGEQQRQRINAWLRADGPFDAVLDFERTRRDPAHPDRLLPAYDSGDHLHPNTAGHKALADAVDFKLLTTPE